MVFPKSFKSQRKTRNKTKSDKKPVRGWLRRLKSQTSFGKKPLGKTKGVDEELKRIFMEAERMLANRPNESQQDVPDDKSTLTFAKVCYDDIYFRQLEDAYSEIVLSNFDLNCINANIDRLTQAMRLCYGLEMKKNFAPPPNPEPSMCQTYQSFRTPMQAPSVNPSYQSSHQSSHQSFSRMSNGNDRSYSNERYGRPPMQQPRQPRPPNGMIHPPLNESYNRQILGESFKQSLPRRPNGPQNVYPGVKPIQINYPRNAPDYGGQNHIILNPQIGNGDDNYVPKWQQQPGPPDDNQSLISDVTDPTFVAGVSRRRTFFWRKDAEDPNIDLDMSDENDKNYVNGSGCRYFSCLGS